MTKPIIYSLQAMNSQEENTISFSYTGGLMKSNTIIIRSALTNQIIYEATYSSARGRHVIPANSVDVNTYGTQYYIQIKVLENDDTESSWSDSQFAIFITTPTFEVTNVEDEMQVHQSYLETELTYSQEQDELLQEYRFYLYNSSKDVLATSSTMYDTTTMSYIYNGLEDGVFYVRAMGVTVHGYQVDTGYIEIVVDYVIPDYYSNFLLENHYRDGYISYSTNLILIECTNPGSYSFEDGMIDLTDTSIFYDEGFTIPDNVTFILKGRDLVLTNDEPFFAVYSNEENTQYIKSFGIYSFTYNDDLVRFKLVRIGQHGNKEVLFYSPSLTVTSSDDISFWIRRQNGIYLFKVFKNGVEVS